MNKVLKKMTDKKTKVVKKGLDVKRVIVRKRKEKKKASSVVKDSYMKAKDDLSVSNEKLLIAGGIIISGYLLYRYYKKGGATSKALVTAETASELRGDPLSTEAQCPVQDATCPVKDAPQTVKEMTPEQEVLKRRGYQV